MEFRLLGPFEASHESRPVPLGRRQERQVLVALMLAGGVAGTDRLIAAAWSERPPATAHGTLQTYVGRLRRALSPFGVRIERVADGYRLDLGAATVDAYAFRDLVAASKATVDPSARMRLCEQALALWRGESPDRDLTESRLSTAELYARLRLDAGLPVSELLPLARAHPTRERLVALLMTGLHRADRRADALDLFALAAAALADLDVEPAPALTQLRDRISRADPALVRPPAPVYAVRVRDEWLPWNTSGHPALEFCNTFAGWGGKPRPGSDWLRSYRTLAIWAGHLDLTDDWIVTRLLRAATGNPAGAAEALAEARDLRARLYACLTNPGDTAAFKAVAQVAEAAARASALVRAPDGLARWRINPGAGLRLPVLAAARSAADLLADPRRLTIRACPGPECGWLFLDEQGRRRWCSLGTCGGGPTCP